MKIFIDSYNCVMQNPAGGVQTRIKALINEFEKKGIQATLFNKWDNKVTDCDIFHVFKVNHESYDLIKYAKKKGVNVVVSSVVPLNTGLKFKIKLFFSGLLHTLIYFNREVLYLADKIISQTVYEKLYINKVLGLDPDKIVVIPNGVSEVFSEANPEIFKRKYSIDTPFVLQVGSIEENKNQLSTIRALKDTDIPVVFIGGDNYAQKKYYDECIKEATDNMFFTGWIDNNDELLASAYAAAKVVVLPSRKEIFGNSLIEGGMAGARLVATNVLPIREWGIDDFCSTINPIDVKDIGKKIIDAYNAPYPEYSSKVIQDKFSWGIVASEYIKVYKELLEKKL